MTDVFRDFDAERWQASVEKVTRAMSEDDGGFGGFSEWTGATDDTEKATDLAIQTVVDAVQKLNEHETDGSDVASLTPRDLEIAEATTAVIVLALQDYTSEIPTIEAIPTS